MTHWLGKVFGGLTIIATCVMIALTVMVFHTQATWKAVVKNPHPTPRFNQLGLEPEIAKQEAEYARLRTERDHQLEKLASERAAARERLADLESQIAQLEDESTQREDELAKLTANFNSNEKVVETSRTTYESVNSEVLAAWDDLRKLRHDANAQFSRAVQTATDIAANEDAQRAALVGAGGVYDLVSLSNRQKAVMEKLDVTIHTNVDAPPPRLNGTVTDVRSENLIEISQGGDDGLRIGHTLEVFRGGRYLGRVVVRKTYPERAVAEIMREYRNGTIQRGDRVSTRLN